MTPPRFQMITAEELMALVNDRVTGRGDFCYWCRKPVLTVKSAGIGIYNIDMFDERKYRYPDPQSMYGAVAVLEHGSCAPEAGYYVKLDRLAAEGLEGPGGWLRHMHEKNWWNPINDLDDALLEGCLLSQRLTAPRVRIPIPKAAPRPTARVIQLPKVVPIARMIAPGLRAEVLERDGFRCRRCGAGPKVERLVVDHITPVSKGGTRDKGNLQTLCEVCNMGKSDRDPHPHDLL